MALKEELDKEIQGFEDASNDVSFSSIMKYTVDNKEHTFYN